MNASNIRVVISVLLCAVYGDEDGITCRQQELVTKFQAEKKCAEVGKDLVDYSDIFSHSLKREIVSRLKDRQSAWIAEYAKFSQFVIWDGCFKNTLNFESMKISYAGRVDLHTCSFECMRVDKLCTYVALKGKTCFCINEVEKQLLEIYRESSFCQIPCPNNGMDCCGSNESVSIYKLADVKEITWAEQEPTVRQCVKVKLVNQTLLFATDSCYFSKISGYLCKMRSPSLNAHRCQRMNSSTDQVCVVDELCTRQDAFRHCIYNNGTLINLPNEERSLSTISEESWYWTGLYRTFRLTDIYDNQKACLAVTKADNKLFLDPDKCITKKRYMCKATHSSTSSTSHNVSKFDKDASIISSVCYIAIVVLLLICLTAAIGFIVYNKRRKCHRSRNTQANDSAVDKAVLESDKVPGISSALKNFNTSPEYFITPSNHKQLKPKEISRQKRTVNIGAYSHTVSANQSPRRNTYPANQYDRIQLVEMSKFDNVREAGLDKNITNQDVETPDNTYHTLQHTERSHVASSGLEICDIITGNIVQPDAREKESYHSIKSDKEVFYYTLTNAESDAEIDQGV